MLLLYSPLIFLSRLAKGEPIHGDIILDNWFTFIYIKMLTMVDPRKYGIQSEDIAFYDHIPAGIRYILHFHPEIFNTIKRINIWHNTKEVCNFKI